MARITFGDCDTKAELGDVVELRTQEQEVVKCQETGALMVNIDPDQLRPGDASFLKAIGLTISNPDTTDPVAISVDHLKDTFGDKVAMWWASDNSDDSELFGDAASALLAGSILDSVYESSDDDDDDDDFSSSRSSTSSFGGFGGFGGGSSFGGFGGGSFSGGGASGGW